MNINLTSVVLALAVIITALLIPTYSREKKRAVSEREEDFLTEEFSKMERKRK